MEKSLCSSPCFLCWDWWTSLWLWHGSIFFYILILPLLIYAPVWFFFLSLVLKKNVLGVAGVISGALLYIRDDFRSVDRQTVLQVTWYIHTFLLVLSCYEILLPNFGVHLSRFLPKFLGESVHFWTMVVPLISVFIYPKYPHQQPLCSLHFSYDLVECSFNQNLWLFLDLEMAEMTYA